MSLARWPVHRTFVPDEADRKTKINQRFTELCADLEMVSEALQDPPCLEFRGRRGPTPAVRTGAVTLRMLMDAADDGEVCRVLRAHVLATLKERAETEIDDEANMPEEF